MKAVICSVCGYIALTGEAPENCPVCGSPKTAFKEDENGLQKAENPDKLEGLEQKHVPQISSTGCGLVGDECGDVHVLMGEVVHPMEKDHFITHIDFYVDQQFAGRVELTVLSQPAASFHLKKTGGELSVVENCNKHGNWINTFKL